MERKKIKYKVQVHKIRNATDVEKAKFQFAADLLADEINSDDFWLDVEQAFDTWKYKNGYTFNKFKELVLSGVDKFNDIPDGDLDVYVTFYYSFKNVVGYTTPSTWYTWINRKFFNKFDEADIAGNIAHEGIGHNLGFDHPGTDKQSLVYQLGYLVRRRIKERLKKPTDSKINVGQSFLLRFLGWIKKFFA